MDFLDISAPQFSYPFVDAIKVTSYVNFEVDNEFVVEMVKQVMMPLNSLSSNIVNMLDWKMQGVNLSEYTPQDVHVNTSLNPSAPVTSDAGNLLNEYHKAGKSFTENIALLMAKNINSFIQYLDTHK